MKAETKVGLLFLAAVAMVVVFAFYLGALNPFANSNDLNLAYNFAGGIEVGSPVRVMGIKVGKVKAIEFKPKQKMPSGEEVKLLVRVSIDKDAWKTVTRDSEFFINLAGVIGEKFIEITPGSLDAGPFKVGELVRGQDPPRIDQLISQSYGLAGKILELVEKNETSVVETIQTLNNLVQNFNKALKQVNGLTAKGNVGKLVNNMVTLTSDAAYFSQHLRSPEGKKTMKLIDELIWRLKDLDAKAIKKVLQEEGIKAKLF